MTPGLLVTAMGDPSLDAETCLEKVNRSKVAFLACTTRALPTVFPVRAREAGGRLLLGPVDPRVARLLDGQVVALGAGRPRSLLRAGWQVVVRGPLTGGSEGAGMLVLTPREIEGTLLT